MPAWSVRGTRNWPTAPPETRRRFADPSPRVRYTTLSLETKCVIRDIFLGRRRFDEIQQDLGVARNVLASRLGRLVDEGILERRPYSERPPRHEYFLTEKGIDLWPMLITMMRWGDRHGSWTGGPPLAVRHKRCGGEMDDHFTCSRCGERLGPRDAYAVPGPGATPRVIERLKT